MTETEMILEKIGDLKTDIKEVNTKLDIVVGKQTEVDVVLKGFNGNKGICERMTVVETDIEVLKTKPGGVAMKILVAVAALAGTSLVGWIVFLISDALIK